MNCCFYVMFHAMTWRRRQQFHVYVHVNTRLCGTSLVRVHVCGQMRVGGLWVCVHARMCACVSGIVCVCVCVREREREREREQESDAARRGLFKSSRSPKNNRPFHLVSRCGKNGRQGRHLLAANFADV